MGGDTHGGELPDRRHDPAIPCMQMPDPPGFKAKGLREDRKLKIGYDSVDSLFTRAKGRIASQSPPFPMPHSRGLPHPPPKIHGSTARNHNPACEGEPAEFGRFTPYSSSKVVRQTKRADEGCLGAGE